MERGSHDDTVPPVSLTGGGLETEKLAGADATGKTDS